VLAPVALVMLLAFRIDKMSLSAAQAAFWGYAVLLGLSLSGIFLIYTGTSIARSFFITAATFLTMSLYGYTTHSGLSRVGSFLVMGLAGLIIAGLVNLFLGSTALHLVISVIGVVVFVGLTAYDTQRIKNMYFESDRSIVAGKSLFVSKFTFRLDGVVPVAVEIVAKDIDIVHVGVGDFDAGRIGLVIDLVSYLRVGGRGADQLHNGLMADERLAAPVLRDE